MNILCGDSCNDLPGCDFTEPPNPRLFMDGVLSILRAVEARNLRLLATSPDVFWAVWHVRENRSSSDLSQPDASAW